MNIPDNSTEIKTLKRELKVSKARFEAAIPRISDSLWEYDHERKTLTLLAGALPGFDVEKIIYNAPGAISSSPAVHPDSHQDAVWLIEELHNGAEKAEREIKLVNAEGVANWFLITFITVFDDGVPIKSIISTENITAKKEHEFLHEKERKYLESMVAEAFSSFEVNLTRGRVERINGSPVSWDSNERNSGEDICLQFLFKGDNWIISPNDRDIVATYFHSRALLNAYYNGIMKVEREYMCLNDKIKYWVSTTANLVDVSESGDVYAFVYIVNIDEQKDAENELKKKASMDSLTGFYNREYGIKKISDALVLRKQGTVSALLMLDLDNFKNLNDTCGHSAGDKLLSEMAGAVRALVRKDDIICRLGGDEFFIFMNSITEQLVKSRAAVLGETVSGLSDNTAGKPKVSASIGIVFIDDYTLSFKEIYEMADAALYEAKKRGKNCYVIYNAENT